MIKRLKRGSRHLINRFFILTAVILASLSAWAGESPARSSYQFFSDLYLEGLTLSHFGTLDDYFQVRVGARTLDYQWEFYGVVRGASDTRTLQDPHDVFFDNYVFMGLGADWVITPGIRLTSQLGYSFDLDSKIHRKGLDYRVGTLTYHEWNLEKISQWLKEHSVIIL